MIKINPVLTKDQLTEQINEFKGFLLEIKSMKCRLCEISEHFSRKAAYTDTDLLASIVRTELDHLRKKLCELMGL